MKSSIDNDSLFKRVYQFKFDSLRCSQSVKTGKSVSDVV